MVHMVVDTDPGADDALALLLVAAEREITAVGSVHGNVPAEVAAANVLEILDVAGFPAVPVAMGANHPISGAESTFTALNVHGQDGLGGNAGLPSSRSLADESAAGQLARLARERPGELTLLALGPLTNVALALHIEPRLPILIKEIVWCGGAIKVPGNVSPHAEANARNDPEAADQVLRAGFSLRLVPLDVTEDAWADAGWLDAAAGLGTGRSRSAMAWIERYVEFYTEYRRNGRGCVLYDPLAAAIAMNPGLASYTTGRVSVELSGEQRGRTVLHTGSPSVRIAVTADIRAMLRQLHQALIP